MPLIYHARRMAASSRIQPVQGRCMTQGKPPNEFVGTSEDALPWQVRPSLVEEVAQVLRDRIFSGRYAPGEPMRQVQLSEELRVSRTPLREALRVLENEGLLASEGARGVVVATADLAKLVRAYELREVIDGLAARLAARQASKEQLVQLQELVKEQRKAVSPWQPGAYTQLNVRFHAAIIAVSGNEYLAAQLPLVRLTSQVFAPAVQLTRDRAQAAIAEHGQILDAIRSRDADLAEQLARTHIRNTLSRISADTQDGTPQQAPRRRVPA
jgi:DNA-binding GntR family transcriptional regulator